MIFLLIIIGFAACIYYFVTLFDVKNNKSTFFNDKNLNKIGQFQSAITYDYGDTNAYFNGVITVYELEGTIFLKPDQTYVQIFALKLNHATLNKKKHNGCTSGIINNITVENNTVIINASIPYFKCFRSALNYELSGKIFEVNDVFKEKIEMIYTACTLSQIVQKRN